MSGLWDVNTEFCICDITLSLFLKEWKQRLEPKRQETSSALAPVYITTQLDSSSILHHLYCMLTRKASRTMGPKPKQMDLLDNNFPDLFKCENNEIIQNRSSKCTVLYPFKKQWFYRKSFFLLSSLPFDVSKTLKPIVLAFTSAEHNSAKNLQLLSVKAQLSLRKIKHLILYFTQV